MNFDTELKNYYLVKFQKDGKIDNELEIVWGIIKMDKKRGFQENDYICTTNIVEKIELGDFKYIKTTNSTYKVNHLIESVVLPLEVEVVRSLRSGVSPSQIFAIKESGVDFYTISGSKFTAN